MPENIKPRPPAPGKSLADVSPEVAAGWHPSKNGRLRPSDVSFGSRFVSWWLCPKCGHEWKARVAYRANGSGCPECARSARWIPKPGHNLATRHPAVAKEWHPTKNGQLTPEDISFGSKHVAWWFCETCGHEWTATVAYRASGYGCRECARRPNAGRDLLSCEPDVAKEWHPTKNGNLTPADVFPSTSSKVWWLCAACGLEWKAQVKSRTSHYSKCPECAKRPKPGRDLATRCPQVAADWHPTKNGDLTPHDVSAASEKWVWWKCHACGFEWPSRVDSRTQKQSGCRQCSYRAKEVPRAGRDLQTRFPAVAADLHPLRNAIPDNLAAQWHPTKNGTLSADMVAGRSQRKVWWLCPECSHSWFASVANRTAGTGCPECARKRNGSYSVKENQARFEAAMADEFVAELNPGVDPSKVTRGSGLRLIWRCAQGHTWKTRVDSRARGRGCPECSKKSRAVTKLTTETTAQKKTRVARTPRSPESYKKKVLPESLLPLWHPTKNLPVTPKTAGRSFEKHYTWVCSECGSDFVSSVQGRLKAKYPGLCPECRSKARWPLHHRGQVSAQVRRQLAAVHA